MHEFSCIHLLTFIGICIHFWPKTSDACFRTSTINTNEFARHSRWICYCHEHGLHKAFFIVIWDLQLLNTVCLLFWLVLISIQTQRIHFSLPPTEATNIFPQQSKCTRHVIVFRLFYFFLVYTRWKIWLFLSLVPFTRCCERVSVFSLLLFDRTKSTYKFRREKELKGSFVWLVLIFWLFNRFVDTQNTMSNSVQVDVTSTEWKFEKTGRIRF